MYFDSNGVEKLYRAARAASRDKLKLTRKDVREWVRSQETYTLHKPVRKTIHATECLLGVLMISSNPIWLIFSL